jgi:DNA polymerase III epsilon subunit-like protein
MSRAAPFFVFDTETTGLPTARGRPAEDVAVWPRVVQLGWGLFDEEGVELELHAPVIRPDGFVIPADAVRLHGITTDLARELGVELRHALNDFIGSVKTARVVVAHNLEFDRNVVRAEIIRLGLDDPLRGAKGVCTQRGSTEFCAIPGNYGFKWPTLAELHSRLFGEPHMEAHEAAVDLRACARCFFELRRLKVLHT